MDMKVWEDTWRFDIHTKRSGGGTGYRKIRGRYREILDRYREIRGIYWKILERYRGFEMRDTRRCMIRERKI
jgi:hypothetical protein